VKPADLLGLVAIRTVHALECVEKQTGMDCSVAPPRYRRVGGGGLCHRCKNVFLTFFYSCHVFYVFNVFYFAQRFFYFFLKRALKIPLLKPQKRIKIYLY